TLSPEGGGGGGGGGGIVSPSVMSTNAIRLSTAPAALVSVSRPSVTVTFAVPSTHGFCAVGVPLTIATFSALILYTAPLVTVGSPKFSRNRLTRSCAEGD